jgi:hypothetical protein
MTSKKYGPPAKSSSVSKKSLIAFINHSDVIHQIDEWLSKRTSLQVVSSDAFVEAYLTRLSYIGIGSIEATEHLLLKRASFIKQFAMEWFKGPAAERSALIPEGVAISFLGWLVVLEKGGRAALLNFLKKHAFNKNQDIKKLALDLSTAYKKAQGAIVK